MKNRCLNSNSPNYARYGGRGITIYSKWIASFEAFLLDMGERPENTSLDRINNELGYTPKNCRWAYPSTQSNNTNHGRRGSHRNSINNLKRNGNNSESAKKAWATRRRKYGDKGISHN